MNNVTKSLRETFPGKFHNLWESFTIFFGDTRYLVWQNSNFVLLRVRSFILIIGDNCFELSCRPYIVLLFKRNI